MNIKTVGDCCGIRCIFYCNFSSSEEFVNEFTKTYFGIKKEYSDSKLNGAFFQINLNEHQKAEMQVIKNFGFKLIDTVENTNSDNMVSVFLVNRGDFQACLSRYFKDKK